MEILSHALELRGVNKRFGNVYANKAVDLKVLQGSIHGIVGENGAGKSTLMNGITGFQPFDSGEILIKGTKVNFNTTEDSIAVGIGMVHQHFMLVESLSVLENVILGSEGGAFLNEGLQTARSGISRLIKDYGLDVPLDAKVADLGVGIQQRVEILKTLYRGAELLILDEPTAVLTPSEVEALFKFLNNLREQGKTVLFVTHKLKEIMAVTDRVTVMKQGEVVLNVATALTSPEQLAETMVGRPVLLDIKRGSTKRGDICLRAQGLKVFDCNGVPRLNGVSLDLYAGEIVGIAGVASNGQSELIEVLAGLIVPNQGIIECKETSTDKWIDITALKNGALGRRKLGIAHVPEDRLKLGVVPSMSAEDNIRLGSQFTVTGSKFFTSTKVIARECEDLMQQWDVRPLASKLSLDSFSGGNQQKMVLGREINSNPRILIIGQPTRGVDIGAIEAIHKRLIELRDSGVAILLISVELDEILTLSDRILVMNSGLVIGEVSSDKATERGLGLMMAGIVTEETTGEL
jgi:simple sugar transport system ATP-binding protein